MLKWLILLLLPTLFIACSEPGVADDTAVPQTNNNVPIFYMFYTDN